MLRLTLLAAALAVLLPACDSQPPGTDCTTAAPCPPGTNAPGTNAPEVVAGVDLTALFAEPTPAERDSAAARLARTGGTGAARITQATSAPLAADPGDGTTYTLLSFRDAAGRLVASALARIPATGPNSSGALPILFILPDGSGDASEADFITGPSASGLDVRTVQILVAARGAALSARSAAAGTSAPVVRRSEVPADPYRADVLDLLEFTRHLDLIPRADTARVGATGIGRGGAVALLAAERVPERFRAVAPLSAPTTLFDATFRVDVRSALSSGVAGRLPAAEALVAPALAVSRGQISLAEARLRMLEVSAVARAERLPNTHAYHAVSDDVVPFVHLQRLVEATRLTNDRVLVDPVPEVTHAGLLRDTTVRALVASFMDRYLVGLLPT